MTPRWQIILLAGLWTALNCIKPVHLDDASYLQCAREFANHPLNPFAFELNWDQWPEPAVWFTAPAALSYWLAPAARCFFGNPFVMKLWMFPFALMFAWGIYRLCMRFVGSHEMWLTAMTVCSAAFLPAMNLMLDVPALALFLVSLEWMFRAVDRNSGWLAAAAGLLAALAIETKYTTVVAPAILFAAGFFARRFRLAFIASITAVLLVAAWEALLAWKYGQSQFVAQLLINDPRRRLGLMKTILGLPAYFAAPVPFLFVLCGIALRLRGRTIAAIAVLVSIAILAAIEPLFSVLSGVLAILCAMVLIRPTAGERWALAFLMCWGAIEVFAAGAISPFPAVRRWYGVVIVLTLLLARAAFHNRQPIIRTLWIRLSCAACVAVALVFYATDFDEALVRKQSIERAAAAIHERDADAKIWLIGHWGPEYYGQRARMTPLVPDESVIHAGDWLVVAGDVHNQNVLLLSQQVEVVDQPVTKYGLPWSTTPAFYGGTVPLRWHRAISDQVPAAGVQALILRVRRDGVLPSGFSLDELIDMARQRGRFAPHGLRSALQRYAISGDEEEARKAQDALKLIAD
jgi:hypothetical protein